MRVLGKSKISSQWQIVVPLVIRIIEDYHVGEEIEWRKEGEKIVVTKKKMQ